MTERAVKPGDVVTVELAGSEVVVFRTLSGRIVAIHPYCPHLGAHLGRGGQVTGEAIQCPFHHFRFAPDGECVAAPGSEPPKNTRLHLLPARVVLGLVMVYYGPGGFKPAWDLVVDYNEQEWTPLKIEPIQTRTHIQEIVENALDFRHLTTIHDFEKCEQISDMQLDGPRIYIANSGILKFPLRIRIPFKFYTTINGLGLSVVELHLSEHWKVRQAICSRPLTPSATETFVGVSIRRLSSSGIRRVVHAPLEWSFRAFALWRIAAEFRKDKVIWENKVLLKHPRLARGDEPIGRYRHWVKQFYAHAHAELDDIVRAHG